MRQWINIIKESQSGFNGIVYHGSPRLVSYLHVDPERGVYFSSDMAYAKDYGEHVYKCHVAIDKPRVYTQAEAESDMEIERRALIAQGFDGRIIKYDNGEMDVIAFYPKQIKKIERISDQKQ